MRNGYLRDARETSLGSCIWRKLLNLKPLATGFIKMEVRNGQSTYFWSDRWLQEDQLIDIVGEPMIYQLRVPPAAKVSEIIVGNEEVSEMS